MSTAAYQFAPIEECRGERLPSSGMFRPRRRRSPSPPYRGSARRAALRLELSELLTDLRFHEPAVRKRNQEELRAIIAARLAGLTGDRMEACWPRPACRAARCDRCPSCWRNNRSPHATCSAASSCRSRRRDAALSTAGFKLNGRRVAPELGAAAAGGRQRERSLSESVLRRIATSGPRLLMGGWCALEGIHAKSNSLPECWLSACLAPATAAGPWRRRPSATIPAR